MVVGVHSEVGDFPHILHTWIDFLLIKFSEIRISVAKAADVLQAYTFTKM